MPKNVTVQIDDELLTMMDKLPDVNWSQVVRSCLQSYCHIRLNPDIEALMQKMKGQKEEAYSEGYRAALEWFKQDSVRYEDINGIFQELDKIEQDFNARIERIIEEHGDWRAAQEEGALPLATWESEKRRFWNDTVKRIIEELADTFEISDAFIEGFKAALKKLEKVS